MTDVAGGTGGIHHQRSALDRHLNTLESARVDQLPGDAPFALCLTHDVDRPYKGLRGLYYAARERPAYHLETVWSSENPYWQFDALRDLEADLGVRSAWYFLNEQHLLRDRPPRAWLSPANWTEHLGRYDPTAPPIAGVIDRLEAGGWEVGLHGSYHSGTDRDRLAAEKRALASVVDGPIRGGRQHHLRLSVPESWQHHRAIGLSYDASLGSTTDCGFHHGYHPLCPFDDAFVVFPLTIMDQALPDPGQEPTRARDRCATLLEEAAANGAVLTALWHPRYMNEREFPGHRACYRWLIERAQDAGAWIGSPAAFLAAIDWPPAADGAPAADAGVEQDCRPEPWEVNA